MTPAMGDETGRLARPVFIPGWKNRLAKWLIANSSFIRKTMQRKVEERDLKQGHGGAK